MDNNNPSSTMNQQNIAINIDNVTIKVPDSDNFTRWKKQFYLSIKQNLWIGGCLGSFLVIIACCMPYALTSDKGHYNPIFPYVSDTASFLPAANYFSQLIDFIALIIVITIWARTKQIKYYLNEIIPNSTNKHINNPTKLRLLHQLNFVALILALVAAFGTVMVGNFRMAENLTFHMIGVTLLFGFLPIIIFIQVYTIEQLYQCDRIETRPYTLAVFGTILSISVLTSGLAALIAIIDHGTLLKYWDIEFRLHWNEQMAGYNWHLASTIAEWVAILAYVPVSMALSNRLRLFKHWSNVSF